MLEEIRGLSISVTIELIEELLKKHVENVPEDLKLVGTEAEYYNQSVRFYFKSKKFPIVEHGLKVNAIVGLITASYNENRKLNIELSWRDLDRKGSEMNVKK